MLVCYETVTGDAILWWTYDGTEIVATAVRDDRDMLCLAGGQPRLGSRHDHPAWGPREIDRKIHSADEWCAWARGPDRERPDGRGTGPSDALLQLRVKLKELVN